MDLGNFRIELGQTLRDIREKYTDLNQEQFYFKYLQALSGRKIVKGSAAQNFMKQLECGTINCPAQFIPIYASVAKITEADIFSFENVQKTADVHYTYDAILKMFVTLINKFAVDNSEFKEHSVLRITDPIIQYMLETYSEFKILLLQGKISQTIYDMWEKNFLTAFNGRLLDFSPFNNSESEVYMSALISTHTRDVAKAYRMVIEEEFKNKNI